MGICSPCFGFTGKAPSVGGTACFAPPLGLSHYFSSGRQDNTSAMAVPDSQADDLRPRWCMWCLHSGVSHGRERVSQVTR